MENNVFIPEELYEKIQNRLKETDFNSVSEYVAYVLGQVISELEEEQEEEHFTKEDEEKVKERLRSLGYIE